jgi:hypothetical protein
MNRHVPGLKAKTPPSSHPEQSQGIYARHGKNEHDSEGPLELENTILPDQKLCIVLCALVRRFAHVERLHTDKAVQAILGTTRMPPAVTLTRYFGGLARSQIEPLSAMIGQFVLTRLALGPLRFSSNECIPSYKIVLEIRAIPLESS